MANGLLSAIVLASCFGQPQAVTIESYSDHAMEPFIARDGRRSSSTTAMNRLTKPIFIGRA